MLKELPQGPSPLGSLGSTDKLSCFLMVSQRHRLRTKDLLWLVLIHSPNYSFFWEIDIFKCKLLEDRGCVLAWVVKCLTQSNGKYQPGRQEPWNLGFTVILALPNYLAKWGHWFMWNQGSFELMVVHWRNIHQWMWTAKHHSQASPSWRQLPPHFSLPCPVTLPWLDRPHPAQKLQLVLFPLLLFETMWLNHYCVFGLCFLTLEWSKHLSSSTFTFGNHRKGGQIGRKGFLLEGRDKTGLLYFSIRVFGALERAACLLFKRLRYSERKKYRQGTVAALGFAPKAGNSLANLKIKYASPKRRSLLDAQPGGRNSVAYIMWTRQCLFFFQRLKKKEVFLLFFNFTKRFQTTEKDFASMFQPSLFLRFIVVFFCFSQQTLPNTPSREGKLSVRQLSDASGTYFFQRRV